MWNPADLYTPSVYLHFVTYHIPTTSTAILTPKYYHSKNSRIKWLFYYYYYYLWSIYPLVKFFIEANDILFFPRLIIREIIWDSLPNESSQCQTIDAQRDIQKKKNHKIFTRPPPMLHVQPIETPPLPCYRISRTHGHSAAQRIKSMKNGWIN